MKSKELLFQLIQSMSKSEKRYFKVSTSVHKEINNYIKLFEAIQAQKEYDEAALLEKFKGEDFTRQFSVAKNYLMNLILKSLAAHHSKAKKSIEINNLLSEIEILYWKGLYKLADKKVKQAKKIAKKFELVNYLLIINHWERSLEEYIIKASINEDKVNEAKECLRLFNQQLEINFLSKKMENLTKASIKLNESAVEEVRKIFNHPHLIKKEDEILNFHAKLDYMFLKGVGNTILGNKEEELYYKKRTIELLEENPHQVKENPLKYASSINNMLLYLYLQNYTDEFSSYLVKLEHIELKFDHAKVQYFVTKYIFELGYYIHIKDRDKTQKSLQEMEEWYSTGNRRKGNQVMMICEFNMALTNYYLGNHKKSLLWCNSCVSLFDMKLKKYRNDLASSALMLQVFIYIDLEYYDLAEKCFNIIIDIANANKYDKSEMEIFKVVDKMIKSQKPYAFCENLKENIEKKSEQIINVDLDIFKIWLEKRE